MRHFDDTIVAIATPFGAGGLGVIRLSGPSALSLAGKTFSNPHLSTAAGHTTHHGWITDGDEKIDEAVASIFRTPHSYTGEDVVEFSCHGSPTVLKEVLALLEKKGARLALPGEFTQRAYLNGKIDLSQAEAVADLIAARSSSARKAATDQLAGTLSQRIGRLRQGLIDLLAQVEANLDFAEEDIPGMARSALIKEAVALRAQIESLLATSVRGRMIRDGIRVALVGKPNVGKSSLFNALLARDRAIVTNVPGTTRDILDESLEWGGIAFVLSDTAGLRSSVDPVEIKGTERTRRAIEGADLALFVIDGSVRPDDQDREAAQSVPVGKALGVLNKVDLPAACTAEEAASIFGMNFVPVSAKNATGLDHLRVALTKSVSADSMTASEEPWVTNLRHVQLLEAAADALRRAERAAAGTASEEAIAVPLKEALESLSSILGLEVNEDVLSAIFSRFCIGK